MATGTLTTAQKAPVLVDNAGIGSDYTVTSSDEAILAVLGGDPQYVAGETAGDATITVTKGARTGVIDVTVTDEPLAVSLGAPSPK